MKKNIVILLLFSTIALAQNSEHTGAGTYISLSADIRNGILGSEPTDNKPEPDFVLRAGAISNMNLQIGIGLERFSRIEFNKYFFEIGQRINSGKFNFTPTIEAGWIERYKMNSWTVGANFYAIYFINDHVGIMITNNLSWRTDLNELYGGDNWKFSNL